MNLESLCQQVNTIAIEVGIFIREENRKFTTDAVEVKSKNSLVSYVDKTAEERLVQRLGALLPEAGFIAEEGTSTKKGDTYQWIIDPLDGTTNFIHSIPVYAVSIALAKDNDIILGVVYEVNRNECFYAWQEGGAWLNETSIHVSSTAEVSNALVATGFPYYDYNRLNEYMELLQHFMHHSRGVRRLGSAAVDLAYVACGRFEGFYEYGLNAWDVAAGAFIVEEAGGVVNDFKGGRNFVFGREIVATGANIHPDFQTLVQKYFTTFST